MLIPYKAPIQGSRAARQGGAADRDPSGGNWRRQGSRQARRRKPSGTPASRSGDERGQAGTGNELGWRTAGAGDMRGRDRHQSCQAERHPVRRDQDGGGGAEGCCQEIGSSPEVIAFAPKQALLQRVDEEIRPLVLKHLKRINAPVIVMQRLPPIEEEAVESLFQRTYKIPFSQAKQDSDDLGDRAWLYTFTEHERDKLQEVFPHLEASSVARSVGELFARGVFGEGWRFRDVQLHLSGRSIWILDFGLCSPLDMDLGDAGAFKAIVPAQAIAADLQYLQNREEREIWREFETAVKEAAGRYDKDAGASSLRVPLCWIVSRSRKGYGELSSSCILDEIYSRNENFSIQKAARLKLLGFSNLLAAVKYFLGYSWVDLRFGGGSGSSS
ncbi:hypothetical protein SELMODRAFT_413121 [Selaginella moellendorffii]|uniref:Uncharacterized protein n=1 Tax=Selaginella moellendorffii TaxID=88036 RepID=D8RNF0_SELML|nr:hypothetical protein SELMODRAFT_413121 [Selaginella moellendorffii]